MQVRAAVGPIAQHIQQAGLVGRKQDREPQLGHQGHKATRLAEGRRLGLLRFSGLGALRFACTLGRLFGRQGVIHLMGGVMAGLIRLTIQITMPPTR